MLPAVFTPQFLARLETLQLRSRRKFVGSRPGRHASPRRGAGLEFADYRPYTPGDDPRSIDWKLYCRTDRHYIKLFQEEEDLYTYLFLDLSASMAHPSGDAKYAAARDLTLALAYIVLAGDDAVKLHALSGAETEPATPFFRGRRRFIQLHDFLADLQPQGRLHPPTALARHLHTLHRPGKAIWVSDFLFPVDVFHTSLNLLRAANFDLAVVQVLGRTETDPPLRPAGAPLCGQRGRRLGPDPLRCPGQTRLCRASGASQPGAAQLVPSGRGALRPVRGRSGGGGRGARLRPA